MKLEADLVDCASKKIYSTLALYKLIVLQLGAIPLWFDATINEQ
jgi:hypothetical protein